MQIVELRKNETYCDSHIVARKFNVKHAYVVDRINKVYDSLREIKGIMGCYPKCVTEEREYRNQKYTAHLMNRDFFTFLVMRFKGKKAIEWQLKFISAFNELEKRVLIADKNASDPQFLEQRKQGIIARRKETDVIKDFVNYATSQGSTKANYYYKHITNMTYKALGLMFQKKPKLRDTMNITELAQLLLCENMAKEALRMYMKLGRHYKDIYDSVKDDLIAYADNIRMPLLEGA